MLTREELIRLFSLEGVGKADAVFGLDKLDWFNSQYLRNASPEVLRRIAMEELQAEGIMPFSPGRIDAALALLKSRIRKVKDFSTVFRAFFADDYPYDEAAAARFLKEPALRNLIPELLSRYRQDAAFALESTEETLRRFAEDKGVKAGLLINALRVALTGQGVAPGLFEIMQVLGREKTLSRIERLAEYLQDQ